MRHLGRHAYALAQRGVRVYGLADFHRVGAHLDGQGDFANQVACVGADDADEAISGSVQATLGITRALKALAANS